MAYQALEIMRKKNKDKYGVADTIIIPTLSDLPDGYGREALNFIRDDCENLMFRTDEKAWNLADSDGRSKLKDQIPYNMERDLDRLCLERAINRFLHSGSREDAFDIYFCYCEIFHPFGGGYEESGILLQLLSEHESNASSLLMKHRDHYSHSVYVFCIGLAIYKHHTAFRKAYHDRFGRQGDSKDACHFLQWWGLTSLFHDIGYPFEIAHQQMIAYVDKLLNEPIDKDPRYKIRPYISYNLVVDFFSTQLGDPNEFYAELLTDRLSTYLQQIHYSSADCLSQLTYALKDRPIHKMCKLNDRYRMDHAYFSGLLLAKTYLDHHPAKKAFTDDDKALLDSFCAIILHNGLFKYTIREFTGSNRPLHLDDDQPLAYLLMLCDELQCWDRTCYGEKTRQNVYAVDFKMTIPFDNSVKLEYLFDKAGKSKALSTSAYDEMCSGVFLEDINRIIALDDIMPEFKKNPITVSDEDDPQKGKGVYLSESSYLNLYKFAKALHVYYRNGISKEDAEKQFDRELSLEYKLSNIAQARGYAAILEKAHCFYTDRPVDFEPVTDFTNDELKIMTVAEQIRWDAEKRDMGWKEGNEHKTQNDSETARERLRTHDAMGTYDSLSDPNKKKIRDALTNMPKVLLEYDGLTIYRR